MLSIANRLIHSTTERQTSPTELRRPLASGSAPCQSKPCSPAAQRASSAGSATRSPSAPPPDASSSARWLSVVPAATAPRQQ